MPTDHAHVTFADVRVPDSAIFGGEGRGLQVVQHFFNENRIRQAASSLGAAQYCINESVAYALERKPFGKSLASQPGHPVPAGRAADPVRDAARADPQDGLADGPRRPVLRLRQGLDVQLLGQPAVLRGGRPRHAGARRARLLAAQAVRAHLPAPPPVPDHRGRRGDPDAPGGRATCSASCASAHRRAWPRLMADALGWERGRARRSSRLAGPGHRRGTDPAVRRRVQGDLGVRRDRRRTATRTELILRRDPPGRPAEPGAMDREASALSLAHDAGLAGARAAAGSRRPGRCWARRA